MEPAGMLAPGAQATTIEISLARAGDGSQWETNWRFQTLNRRGGEEQKGKIFAGGGAHASVCKWLVAFLFVLTMPGIANDTPD
jgi:hypothetical protein